MNKKKICFVSGSSPEFLGGISIYQKNLINYSKKKGLNYEFTLIYPGNENRKFILDGINCIEIKSPKYPFIKEFLFAKKVREIISNEFFDIINTHANFGGCLRKYNKKDKQKVIHTFHGVDYFYWKVQFARFGFLKYLFYFSLPIIYLLGKPPMKKADEIICVSEKVKQQLIEIYGKGNKMEVIRTGVDLKDFKIKNKEVEKVRKDLDKNKIYGLYVARGGYWNKGLDRAIKLSKEIFSLDKNYRLIVLGPDFEKIKNYIDERFVIYYEKVSREILPSYYSACDFFFSLSRYEGGAPTLALSEAMASGKIVVCSKDSQPEIIVNNKDGLIIEEFDKKDAKKIFELLKDKKKLREIEKNAQKKIKQFSIEKWGKEYFDLLIR